MPQRQRDRQTAASIYTYAITYKTHTYIAIYREKKRETERERAGQAALEKYGAHCHVAFR